MKLEIDIIMLTRAYEILWKKYGNPNEVIISDDKYLIRLNRCVDHTFYLRFYKRNEWTTVLLAHYDIKPLEPNMIADYFHKYLEMAIMRLVIEKH